MHRTDASQRDTTIRVPVDLRDLIKADADDMGMTQGEYLRAVVTEARERRAAQREAAEQTRRTARERLRGRFHAVYPEGYLDELRTEWPA